MENNALAEQETSIAAETWLNLIDAREFTESWNQASSLFKSAVSLEHWSESVEAVKSPLGKTVSRQMKSEQFANELPGAPDGEYVVIQYDASFEHKKNGIETVTVMKDTDNQWHVAGYFIK